MKTEKIYIAIDDERIEATGQELQDILDYRAKKKLNKEALEAEAQAKASAKAALLERLGLTEDEAKLLLS
jgi:hypothetical protein